MRFKQFLKEGLNVSKIESLYDKYNRIAFDNTLPNIPIVITNNKRVAQGTKPGALAATVYTRSGSTNSNIQLVFKNLNLSDDLLVQILVHEMIHVKIASGSERDSSMHGPLFMQYLKQVEAKVGFRIPVDVESKDFYKALNDTDHFDEKEIAIFYMVKDSGMDFFFFQRDKLDNMRINFNSLAYRVKLNTTDRYKEIGYGTIVTRLYKQFPILRDIPFKDNRMTKFNIYSGSMDMYHSISVKHFI